MEIEPIVLYAGDVVEINNQLVRYSKFDINGATLHYQSLLNGVTTTAIPSLGTWGKDTQVRVLQEDCLGHCYDGIAINPEDSTFQQR